MTQYKIYKGRNQDLYETLIKEYEDKVKLVYLDPGRFLNRDVRESSKFHKIDGEEAWRYLMKDVIQKAKQYLHKDGFLAFSVPQKRLAIAKIVADEVFTSSESFIGIIPVRLFQGMSKLIWKPMFHDLYDYVLLYKRDYNTEVKKHLRNGDFDYTELMSKVHKEGGLGVRFDDDKKPELLMKTLIEATTDKKDIVFDMYGGSGTTIASCVKLGRSCVTVEEREDRVKMIQTRLNNIRDGIDTDSSKYEGLHTNLSYITYINME